MRQCANVPIIFVKALRREDMHFVHSLRREDVKSFAALIRQGVKTCTLYIREDGILLSVSTNERSECLHVLTSPSLNAKKNNLTCRIITNFL